MYHMYVTNRVTYTSNTHLSSHISTSALIICTPTSLPLLPIRLRSKDVITLAEEVLPSIQGVRSVLESFSPLSGHLRYACMFMCVYMYAFICFYAHF